MDILAVAALHSSRKVDSLVHKGSSLMSKNQWHDFVDLAERAKSRLVLSGAWAVEMEAREEVSARVEEAVRCREHLDLEAAADA